MVLPLCEELVPVREAFKSRFGNVVPDYNTVWRWRTAGAHGAVLECTRIGRHWYTLIAAVERFVAAQNPDLPPKRDGGRTAETADKLKAAGLLKSVG